MCSDKAGKLYTAAIIGAAFLLTACATPYGSGSGQGAPASRTQTGALIGAATGAIAGALLKKNKRGKGALVGAALGAAGGALIGNYMDKQAAELRQVAEVVRVDDGIVVTMHDQILFDVGSADVKLQSQESLRKLAGILQKYDKTEITIAGHTDSTGGGNYNQQLSDHRANSVRLFLISQGVPPGRLGAMGFGETKPVASNSTPGGRAANRRVELHISPDERLLENARRAG